MSGWRARAEKVLKGEDVRDIRDNSPVSAPNVPIVPIVPAPKTLLREWVSSVSALDPRKPLAGHDARGWFNLVECSVWWLDNFGWQAALDGWQTHDVFGVIPGSPGAGGLIDRLGTSRPLVMEGRRSRWRSFGVAMKYNAGAYKHMPLFWDGC